MSFFDLRDLPEQEPIPGFRGRFVHTPTMTVAYWDVTAGAVAPEHAHPHEQVLNLIDGRQKPDEGGVVRWEHSGRSGIVCQGGQSSICNAKLWKSAILPCVKKQRTSRSLRLRLTRFSNSSMI